MAGNVISNYGLEAIQINCGPAAVVANRFQSHVSGGATCALRSDAGQVSVNGTQDDPQDYSRYVLGNLVDGGRTAELSGTTTPSYLHFSGNSISLLPAFPLWDDIPSALAAGYIGTFVNISGNTLLTGQCAVVWYDCSTNALVLKNDFRGASIRALEYYGSNGVVRNIQILKNILNQGNSYHLKLKYPDSAAFFLQKNIYTNGVTRVDPFLDAAASPVHIMH